MNSFEGVNVEDLTHCPQDNFASGIKTKIYYAPTSYLDRIDLPTGKKTYDDFVSITQGGIEFRGGGWNAIDVLIGENELKQNLVGPLQRKKSKTELEFFILGFRTKVLGLIEAHKNTPMVFVVVDAVGNNWVIGNLRNRAFMESADVSTQKKYEDNSGAVVKITCNAPIFYFGNAQSWIDEGIFTREFTNEFNFEFT